MAFKQNLVSWSQCEYIKWKIFTCWKIGFWHNCLFFLIYSKQWQFYWMSTNTKTEQWEFRQLLLFLDYGFFLQYKGFLTQRQRFSWHITISHTVELLWCETREPSMLSLLYLAGCFQRLNRGVAFVEDVMDTSKHQKLWD